MTVSNPLPGDMMCLKMFRKKNNGCGGRPCCLRVRMFNSQKSFIESQELEISICTDSFCDFLMFRLTLLLKEENIFFSSLSRASLCVKWCVYPEDPLKYWFSPLNSICFQPACLPKPLRFFSKE